MLPLGKCSHARRANASHDKESSDIRSGPSQLTKTLRTTSQSTKTSCLRSLKMAEQGIDLSLIARDTRQLILSNALVKYPNIVQQHIEKFPNIPMGAADIFDIYIIASTEIIGGHYWQMFTARLTHAHEKYPAARIMLLSGTRADTVERALHGLLEHSAEELGSFLEKVPLREGCVEETTGPGAGRIRHLDSDFNGSGVSEELRKLAADFDKANK